MYLADYLLINLFDQVWIQEFYQPCLTEATEAYENEIKKCHKVGRFEDLMMKKHNLSKLYKLMNKIQTNQSSKSQYANILSQERDQKEVKDVKSTIQQSISNLLTETCNKTSGLSEFCQEIKHYQGSKFIPSEFK